MCQANLLGHQYRVYLRTSELSSAGLSHVRIRFTSTHALNNVQRTHVRAWCMLLCCMLLHTWQPEHMHVCNFVYYIEQKSWIAIFTTVLTEAYSTACMLALWSSTALRIFRGLVLTHSTHLQGVWMVVDLHSTLHFLIKTNLEQPTRVCCFGYEMYRCTNQERCCMCMQTGACT